MNPQVNKCLECKDMVYVQGIPVCGLEQLPCVLIRSCPVERIEEYQRKMSTALLSPKLPKENDYE